MPPMNRTKARQYTLIAQVTGAMLALAAVALGVLDRPQAAPPPPDLGAAAPAPPEQPKPALPSPDISSIAFNFQPDGPSGEPDAVAQQPGDDDGPKPPAPTTDFRYLGSVLGMGKAMALVSHDGRQHLLTVGKELAGYTIAEVHRNAIVVDGPNGRQTLDKAERTGEPITMAAAQAPGGNLVTGRPTPASSMRDARDRVNRANQLTPADRAAQESDTASKIEKLRAESEARRKSAQIRKNGATSGPGFVPGAPVPPIEDHADDEGDHGEQGP